jgi:hypothetical protein
LTQRLVLGELALPDARAAIDDDGAGMHKAADAGKTAGIEQIGGGVDDLALEEAPRSPIADAGRTVVDHIGLLDGAGQALRLGEIPEDQLDSQRTQERSVARRPHECAYSFAALP